MLTEGTAARNYGRVLLKLSGEAFTGDSSYGIDGSVVRQLASEIVDARADLGVDVAVSVTGIAGPGGGSEEKPVGLVYLCASGPDGERERDFVLPGDRESIRLRAAVGALHLVHALVTKT